MTPARVYRVVVAGHVGAPVADALGPLRVEASNGATTVSGDGLDAAALAGVLGVIDRLGLELVTITSEVAGG